MKMRKKPHAKRSKPERSEPAQNVASDVPVLAQRMARITPPPAAGLGLPAVNRSSLADQAYTYLFHKITTGEFREGEMLPTEHEMSAMFGVSRPVVREALERLRVDGLVASRRGLGSFVQPRLRSKGYSRPDSEKLRAIEQDLEFRCLIEPEAAVFAAERRTKQDLKSIRVAVEQFEQVAIHEGAVAAHLDFSFHLAVARAGHNLRIVEAIQSVEYDISHGVNLFRYMVRYDHLARSRQVLDEHTRILKAIECRDTSEARAAMSYHLDQAHVRMAIRRPELAMASK